MHTHVSRRYLGMRVLLLEGKQNSHPAFIWARFSCLFPRQEEYGFDPGAGKYSSWSHKGLNSSCSKCVSWERAAVVRFMKNCSLFLPGYRVHFSTDTSLTNTQREHGMGSQVIVLSWQRLLKEEQDLYRGCSGLEESGPKPGVMQAWLIRSSVFAKWGLVGGLCEMGCIVLVQVLVGMIPHHRNQPYSWHFRWQS